MRIATALLVSSLTAGCAGPASHGLFVGDAGAGTGGPPDLTATFSDDAGDNGTCDDQHGCSKGRRCYQGACIPDNGTCTNDNECENDTYCDCTMGGGGDAGACMGGVCVPYGIGPRGSFDPDCATPGFSATQFVAPKLKCHWEGTGTLVTPIVADLDGDKKPEIIFLSYPNGFTALHGTDCSVYFTKTFTFAASNQSQLAVADLDGDKIPEIVGVDGNNQVVVFDNKGNLLATSPTPVTFTGVGQNWGGPAIADVDNIAPPEIIVAAQVSRYVKGNGITVLWTQTPEAPEFGPLTIAADLDGDGKPEVIAGKAIYNGMTGADKTPANLKALQGAGAFPAIGDFNGDQKPDIVLIQSKQNAQRVSIFDYANNKFIFGPFDVPMGFGGPPTVADFDGDGKPEFASAGLDWFYLFDTKCAVKNKPKFCDPNTDYGVRWKKKTQDHSSGSTGSSVFDFNGDGIAEVVYRDECWLRVYNGPDGKTIFAANVTSATALELPVIADLDNDGHAKIVVTSDNFVKICPGQDEADTGTKWVGQTTGIFVFQDPKNRWMPSRNLWNQHSYHITNVNNDLSVPTKEKNNWLTYNNYRQNVQGNAGFKPNPAADFTGGVATSVDPNKADCAVAWTLHANLCNRGTATVMPGIAGTFYSSDPRLPNPRLICSTKTSGELGPAQCEAVECDWKSPPVVPTDLWFRANDDGTGAAGVPECKSLNDILFIPQAVCSKIG